MKFFPQKRNSWEVLLDNKLPLKDLIAAHLEPLTHSSSTILSTWQEWKKTHTEVAYLTTQSPEWRLLLPGSLAHHRRRRRVWSALRWWRVGANWQQVQMCFKSYIHVRADVLCTPGRAAQHSAARRKPEQTAASPNQIWHHLLLVLMHCHQPQRGARFVFFVVFFFLFLFNNIKTQTQILALALLFPGCSVPSRSLRLLSNVSRYFCDCSHTAPSPSIHHASVLLVRPPLPPLHMIV